MEIDIEISYASNGESAISPMRSDLFEVNTFKPRYSGDNELIVITYSKAYTPVIVTNVGESVEDFLSHFVDFASEISKKMQP